MARNHTGYCLTRTQAGLGCSCAVEHFPRMLEALSWTHSVTDNKNLTKLVHVGFKKYLL